MKSAQEMAFSPRQRFALRMLAGPIDRTVEAFALAPEVSRSLRLAVRQALARVIFPDTFKREHDPHVQPPGSLERERLDRSGGIPRCDMCETFTSDGYCRVCSAHEEDGYAAEGSK